MIKRNVMLVVGGDFGDEGKGKIVSYIAKAYDYRHVARGGGGTNAGHTVVYNGKICPVRMIPSGFVNPNAQLYIGRGVAVDRDVLLGEIKRYEVDGRVWVDRLCPIIERRHIDEDRGPYNKTVLNTTGTGTGPAQLERVKRTANLRFAKDIDSLKPYLADVGERLYDAIERDEKVLGEGTQGTFISNYGFEFGDKSTYPEGVTTKDTTAGTLCADIGIGPTTVESVVVVFKSIASKVGNGPFPNEITDLERLKYIEENGQQEYGTVTGRKRRMGDFDYDRARIAMQRNGGTIVALTKLDALFPEVQGQRYYNNLTGDAMYHIRRLEDESGSAVVFIGTGPEVDDMVDRRMFNYTRK